MEVQLVWADLLKITFTLILFSAALTTNNWLQRLQLFRTSAILSQAIGTVIHVLQQWSFFTVRDKSPSQQKSVSPFFNCLSLGQRDHGLVIWLSLPQHAQGSLCHNHHIPIQQPATFPRGSQTFVATNFCLLLYSLYSSTMVEFTSVPGMPTEWNLKKEDVYEMPIIPTDLLRAWSSELNIHEVSSAAF